jgi:hypothetical protein
MRQPRHCWLIGTVCCYRTTARPRSLAARYGRAPSPDAGHRQGLMLCVTVEVVITTPPFERGEASGRRPAKPERGATTPPRPRPIQKTPTNLADLFNAENGTNGRAYSAMRPLLTSTPHKRRTRTITIGALRRPSARGVSRRGLN